MMRHRKKTKKLGRTKAHRLATLRNLASEIFQHKQIKTTIVKAKAARSVVERLITFGKKDTVAARREAFKFLQNHKLVKLLFDDIAPTFTNRKGGYTRVIKLGRRKGDGAELAILQLVGYEPIIIEDKKQASKKKKSKKTVSMESQKTKVEEVDSESEAPVEEVKETVKKEVEEKTKEKKKELKKEKKSEKAKAIKDEKESEVEENNEKKPVKEIDAKVRNNKGGSEERSKEDIK
jgi:large subunit ribosomal protein L17